MIRNLKIENYKSIVNEDIEMKPLTILTGLNSTGKSSVLQSILLQNKLSTNNGRMLLASLISSFDAIRNLYQKATSVAVSITTDRGVSDCQISADNIESSTEAGLEIEENLFYLSANRTGADDFPAISEQFKVGTKGEYLLGTFEKEKSKVVLQELIKDVNSYTLSAQVNYWLSHILGISFELQTEEKSTKTNVEVKYKSDGIPNLNPFQLGMGVSYLTKILILCLRANKGDVIMIENPEIHLHPAAQARLGEFFVCIVKAGIQVIMETHCEHLINRIQYEIYKKQLLHSDVTLLYKKAITDGFECINFNSDGQYEVDFPDGFFDATLDCLLEME